MTERDAIERILGELAGRTPALFLDYDGTLTPIVSRPEDALLSGAMRETLRGVAGVCPVAIVSGRDREDVARLVGLPDLLYAGCHGLDISGPGGLALQHESGTAALPDLASALEELQARVGGIDGILLEPKRFSLSVHFRNVAGESEVEAVEAAVHAAVAKRSHLRTVTGKKVLELRPEGEWNKGSAVLWLLDALGLDAPLFCPVYIGDDVTDEDAFIALKGRGIGIRVGAGSDGEEATAAGARIEDTDDVSRLLSRVADIGRTD